MKTDSLGVRPWFTYSVIALLPILVLERIIYADMPVYRPVNDLTPVWASAKAFAPANDRQVLWHA